MFLIQGMNSQNTNILVLSPDIDVYHIGIPIVAYTNLKVYVLVVRSNSANAWRASKYMSIGKDDYCEGNR